MRSLRSLLQSLREISIPQGSLTKRVIRSGLWAGLINVSDRVLQLGKVVVLANLLAPSDFGLMGIALLSLAALERFSHLGLDAAMIQHTDENVDRYLDTAWTLKTGRSLLIALIAVLTAPYVAQFFGEPRATDIIRVIGVSTLLTGLQNPGVLYFRKKLEFHRQFVYELSGGLIEATVAIGAGLLYQNVWALVFGLLAGRITRLVVSYLVHGYRPRPRFDREKATELYGFGKWLTVSGIVLFLITQGDDAFLGWALGAAALGLYQLAYRFSNAPATEISHVISGVMLPTYSEVQDDLTRLQTAFFRTLLVVSGLALPAAVGIAVVTPIFVRTFLGTAWEAAIVPMQILAVFAIFRAIGASFGSLYQAIGRPDYDTKIQIIHLALLAVAIIPLTNRWGVAGTSLAVTGSIAIASLLNFHLAVTTLETSYRELLMVLAGPGLGALVMGIGVYIIREVWAAGGNVAEFVLLVIAGICIYALTLVTLERAFQLGVREVLGSFRTAFQ